MSDKVIQVGDDGLETISGGEVNPPWSIGRKPRYDGATCPECGVCDISFEQFQTRNGRKEEVYYCPNCDYVIIKL